MAAGNGASEEKPAAVATPPSSGGGNKFILIFSLINLLGTFGMLGFMGLSFIKDKKRPAAEDIAAHAGEGAEGEKAKGKEEEGHGGGEGHAAEGGGEGHGEGHGAEAPKKKLMNFGKMITLEQFTVNLATPGSVNSKYVRVSISLEVPDDDAEGEVNSKMPQVRNVIIDLFNSKRPGDLATSEGREFLKEEIKNGLNNFLVVGKVKGVFFTNFSVSS